MFFAMPCPIRPVPMKPMCSWFMKVSFAGRVLQPAQLDNPIEELPEKESA
jgi:hypothetical protein